MKSGDTFVPARYDDHLWIVLSDPDLDPHHVVIVNFTTHTIDEEQVCVVKKGEHPWIRHKTAVRYWDAKVVSSLQLSELLAKGLLKPNIPLSAALLGKVRAGASLSDFLPEGCRKVLDEQNLI